MNGQGQAPGSGLGAAGDFTEWENESDLSILLGFRGSCTVRDFRAGCQKSFDLLVCMKVSHRYPHTVSLNPVDLG